MPQPKTRIYEIHQSKRVSNSPYMLENTNIRFDVAKEMTLPNSTTALIDGEPVELRFITRAASINKREQIRQGWPEVYRANATDNKFLTFIDGRLEVPESQKNAIEFLETSPWFSEHKHPRLPGVTIVYIRVDTGKTSEAKLDLQNKALDAKLLIRNLQPEQARDLLRLSKPNKMLSSQIALTDVKLQLNEIADKNPDFILNGVKSNEDKLAVLLSKAVNLGVINLDTVGNVSLVQNGEFKPLITVSEAGGRERKFEKTLMWLQGDEGKAYVSTIEDLIEEAEDTLTDPESKKQQKPPAPKTDEKDITKWNKPQLQARYEELFNEEPEESQTKADLIEAIKTKTAKQTLTTGAGAGTNGGGAGNDNNSAAGAGGNAATGKTNEGGGADGGGTIENQSQVNNGGGGEGAGAGAGAGTEGGGPDNK